MRIQIDIPKEFEEDYRKDGFRDFFERVRADIDCRGLCGNYERETAEMFKDAWTMKEAIDVQHRPKKEVLSNENSREAKG